MTLVACTPSAHDSTAKGVGISSNYGTWSTANSGSLHQPTAKNESRGIEQPALFKITSAGSTSASYLLGTVHVGVALSELPKWVLDLHSKTQVHAYEMNKLKEFRALRNNRSSADFGALAAYATSGGPLKEKNVFNASETAALVKLGIPEVIVRVLTDKSCSAIAMRRFLFTRDHYDSIDGDLEERTVSLGKRLVELETEDIRKAADEYARSVGYSDSCSIRALINNPTKLNEMDQQLDQLFRVYRGMTLADLSRLPLSAGDDDPATAYRNRIWLPRIAQLVRSQPTFIAVGLMHLEGPEGLVQGLRNLGFSVEPMSGANILTSSR